MIDIFHTKQVTFNTWVSIKEQISKFVGKRISKQGTGTFLLQTQYMGIYNRANRQISWQENEQARYI